ncbi:hypothetical protein P3S67_028363 [Capsicum chacoense]
MSYRLFLLASFFLCQLAFSSSIPYLCNKDESISIVTFKKSLTIDPSASADCDYSGQPYYGKISSWNMSRDCCSWDGVICDEMTGHVVELDLSCSQLVGNIDSNSSLFQLSRLQRLNLSRNTFSNSHILPLFGRLSSLTHLDLSYTSFSGQIPSEISHLSKLQSLHLLNYDIQLGPHTFKILLQNLRLLDLRLVNISSTIPPKFSSHLTTLRLGDTDLYGIIPESIFHLSNLKELDLSYNDHLSGYFPTAKWNSTASIEELYLSQLDFSGSFLPESIGYLTSLRYNLTRLEHLDLKGNLLEGSIPLFTSGLQNLSYLRLLNNLLNGVIPSWKFSLPSLSKLDLKDNHFCGQLEDFRYNSVLTHIDLGHNQLQGYLSESIQKLANLASIHLEHNQFQGPLPKSLQNLMNLTWLDLSSNNFSGNVDVSIFSNLEQLFLLELSHNSISLTNENNVNSTVPESVESLGLSGCEIRELDFLRSAKQLLYLDLSNNKIQGRIPDWALSNWMNSMSNRNLSHNMLTSSNQIHLLPLLDIDLRSNFLQGPLPIPPPTVQLFFMSKNNLTGEIPSSFCNLTLLGSRIPDSAELNKVITADIGSLFQCFYIKVTNKFFPTFECHEENDQTMKAPSEEWLEYYQDSVVIATKGQDLEVVRILYLYTTIDLSNNKFEGHIPSVMGDLISLRVLNMSFNGFQGHLPPSLRKLSVFESLDLSLNNLSGVIPQQLSSLTSLEDFNLSHNHLEGCIPRGPQLGTFGINSYEGIDGLRGFPISKDCGSSWRPETKNAAHALDEESNSSFLSELSWKVVLMGYGSGLCIGFSIAYVMLSSPNLNCFQGSLKI